MDKQMLQVLVLSTQIETLRFVMNYDSTDNELMQSIDELWHRLEIEKNELLSSYVKGLTPDIDMGDYSYPCRDFSYRY